MTAIAAVYLKTLTSKSIGLLGAKKAYPVFFKTRWGIHTYFLQFSIDVLILDSGNIVIKAVKDLPPYSIVVWHPRYENVLELPAGEIKKNDFKLGDRIEITYTNLPHKR